MMQQREDEWGRTARSGNSEQLSGMAKVRDRLTKILARTKSPNEQEAASAASMLQAMLTEHNLSMADLEQRGQKSPGMREQPHDLGKAAFKWKLDLADGIAAFYYCAPLIDRKAKTVAFVGRPDNVEALTMLYEWVINQIKDIAREERRAHCERSGEHIDPLRWQINFGVGAVERLIVRLRELKAKQEYEVSRDAMGDVTAMVVHRQAEVSDYLEEKFGYRLDGKKTQREQAADERYKKWEEEWQAKKDKQEARRVECEANGDMESYWAEYPEEHPDEVEKRAQETADYAKEEARKAKRNRNRSRGLSTYRAPSAATEKRDDQGWTARQAGREAAGKVNLQPFITGQVERKKVG